MIHIKGDVVLLTLANGREYEAEVVVGQEEPGDLFKVRIIDTGTMAEIDPTDIDVKLIRRPEANITKEESVAMNVETAIQENVAESVVTNVARRRKSKVVITQETVESFSRWVDVELPDGTQLQAQIRVLPSGTAGIMRVRMAFATLNVMIYSSSMDEGDLYIPPVKNTYKTKDEEREVIVIEADEGQIDLLKAIAASVMEELGLSLKARSGQANSPTRSVVAETAQAVVNNRRFSRA